MSFIIKGWKSSVLTIQWFFYSAFYHCWERFILYLIQTGIHNVSNIIKYRKYFNRSCSLWLCVVYSKVLRYLLTLWIINICQHHAINSWLNICKYMSTVVVLNKDHMQNFIFVEINVCKIPLKLLKLYVIMRIGMRKSNKAINIGIECK